MFLCFQNIFKRDSLGEVSFEGDIEKDEATGLLRVARKNFKVCLFLSHSIF